MSLSDHRTKKALGQHFLHDANVVSQLLQVIAPQPGERIIEIGPGAGALTMPLLRRHGELTAIEFDRDLIEPLSAAAVNLGQLTLIAADVLSVDFSELAQEGPIRVVGNLPYNISSPILFHLLQFSRHIIDMHFMLQKEVVDRMAADPGGKVYGRLSVMLQAVCRVDSLFDVPPTAFRPPPKVDSAVVRLVPASRVEIADPKTFSALVKAAFAQRRKTLRNTLKGVCDEDTMRACDVDPGARAETLSVEQFAALSNHLCARAPEEKS